MLARNLGREHKRVTQIAALTNSGRSYYSKGNVLGFLRWLADIGPCLCYAHNLQYDLGNLFGLALDAFDSVMVGSRMVRASWGKVVFRDSFNMFPMSLKKLAPMVGLEKLALDEHSKDYVFRDVEIVLRAVHLAQRMALRWGIEKLPGTIGGLSVAVWRAMGGENFYCDDTELAEPAFYGGRVEGFRREINGLIHYTDINSLYPWAMSQEFPAHYDKCKFGSALGVVDCTINVNRDAFIAPLPVRREDGSICYPVGKLRGIWTCAEVHAAEAQGHKVQKIHDCYGSSQGCFPYRNYCETLFSERLNARNDGERLFLKLLLNNLYGQLANRGAIHKSAPINDYTLGQGGHVFGGKILIPQQLPLAEHVNLCHAAHVTSYGRIRLAEYLHQIEPERLLYCDTDSAIFAGECPFPVSAELGSMKLEQRIENGSARFYAPKTYRLADAYKAKGVRRSLAKTFVELGSVEYSEPFRYREAVAWYDRGNVRQLSVWRKVDKSFSGVYDKKRLHRGRFYPLNASRA